MKHLLIGFLLNFANFVFSQVSPGWYYYSDGPTSGRFEDVYFVNDVLGWAVSGEGRIYKTENGTEDWELQIETGDYLRSVEFFDENVGFAGSLFGKLFRTENGGDDWDDISDLLPEPFGGICGMSVADDSTIYVCGIWSEPAYIFKSTDRGDTWEYIDMSEWARALIDMKFTDKNKGFATGKSADSEEGGIILYTEDGGENWEVKALSMMPDEYVWKIQLLDDSHAVSSVEDISGFHPARMMVSDDGGMTWETKTISDDYYNVEMVGFINPDTGWIGGWFDGTFETFDGGDTWHSNDFGNNLNRFFKINDTLAYASGERVYVYLDTTKTIADTTITDTTVAIQNLYQPHAIVNISPNPSDGEISITYQIGRLTTLDMNVFDMKGYKVQTVYHGKIQPGTYTEKFEKDLPPGEYMLSMHTNERLLIKKFIIQ